MRISNICGAVALSLFALAMPASANEGEAEPAAASVAEDTATTVPEQLLQDLQEDFDLTEFQAAAIVGNLAHESGNFMILKQIKGSCYGYPQWCGARKTKFNAYAASAGGPTSYDANYGYIKHELETQYQSMLGRIRSTTSVDAAAGIFMREFLRPNKQKANLKKRIAYAKDYLAGDFDGAACYSHPAIPTGKAPVLCPTET